MQDRTWLDLPGWVGMACFPLLTLLVGVVAGVVVFGKNQVEEARHALGSGVWSANWLWAVKVGYHLILACGIALLLLVPAAIRISLRCSQAPCG